jgi:signal transduction histidine kinase
MGIGLSLSRTIVEAQGGRLWAGSEVGQEGAAFHLTLRAA